MGTSAVIFARGGSKGLPGKNLRKLGGEPLVARAIKLASSVPGVTAVFCSTDSPEIAEVAKQAGGTVPFLRPAHLASDTSPELDSWKHFAQFLVSTGHPLSETFLSLPATAPLREGRDVQTVLTRLATSRADLVVTYTEAVHNPWFNMVALDEVGELSVPLATEKVRPTRRQDAPEVFALVPVAYATTIGYVLEAEGIFSGRVAGVRVPRERAIDVDTEFDFKIAELLWKAMLKDNDGNTALD